MGSWRVGLALVAVALVGCAEESGSGDTGTPGTGTSGVCGVPASCPAVEPECLGLVDNSGRSRFGLRISEIHVSTPQSLTAGLIGRALATDVRPANPACNLDGTGTASWLLRFDTAAATLDVGGARPITDPARGYVFADEMIQGRHVQPTKLAVDIAADGSFETAASQDLLLPIFLDTYGKAIVLPLRAVRLGAGVLSASRGCIGRYDASKLDPANACLPDDDQKAFVPGATLEGLLVLEDADDVVIDSSSMSLCARLAGPELVTTNAQGTTVCRRDADGRILFQGDACAMGAGCADAVALRADLAASAVRIED
ncbi:Hypothetical protein A7982_09668 [Minicystis rosea]|nr:Hypothetical protein A7982_09668 [Minicystis rosea]